MRPGRVLLIFTLAVFVGGALLAPWLYWLTQWGASHWVGLEKLAHSPFHRYVNRCLLVLALAGIWPLMRSLGMCSWKNLGGVKPGGQGRRLAGGFAFGFVSLAVVGLVALGCGAWEIHADIGISRLLKKLLGAALSAVVVAMLEETFFRGAVMGALRRVHSVTVAIILSSAIYALLHFFQRPEPPGDVQWFTGLTLLPQMMRGFVDWPTLVPSFFNLTLAGIILALAYCEDDFQRALMIGNTAGWDTDCNSGNIGCLMGIKNGLRGIDSSPVDWRGPVADRMYLPTADGGRCITDAAQEARRIAQSGFALAEAVALPSAPRFDFELPGSVQGYHSHASDAHIENVGGHSATGKRSLAIRFSGQTRVSTLTFIPIDSLKMEGYGLIASPTLYPGQTLKAGVCSDEEAQVGLFVRASGANNEAITVDGPVTVLHPGETQTLSWTVAGVDGGSPIYEVGLYLIGGAGDSASGVYLDYLTWDGAPTVNLTRPSHNGTLWQRAWVKACDDAGFNWGGVLRACQDSGVGLLIQGEREWRDYTVEATVIPHLAKSAGIAACVQGLKRYYALLLCDDQKVRLVKTLVQRPGQESERKVLAEADFAWELDGEYALSLTTSGKRLIASVGGKEVFDIEDAFNPLLSGAVALVIEEGRLDANGMTVKATQP